MYNQHKDWLLGDRIIVTTDTYTGIVEYIGIIDDKPTVKTLSGITRNINLYLPNETYENVDLIKRNLSILECSVFYMNAKLDMVLEKLEDRV